MPARLQANCFGAFRERRTGRQIEFKTVFGDNVKVESAGVDFRIIERVVDQGRARCAGLPTRFCLALVLYAARSLLIFRRWHGTCRYFAEAEGGLNAPSPLQSPREAALPGINRAQQKTPALGGFLVCSEVVRTPHQN